jgi:transposase
MLCMTVSLDSLDAKAPDAELEARRRAAALGLGLDPSNISWPQLREEHATSEPIPAELGGLHLSDEEWRVLAPLLPAEAPQAKTMNNREFVEAVLDAMRRGGAWVSRQTPAAEIEAVRRRFGRWSHQGVFQNIASALPHLGLSSETVRLLELAGGRARRLKARAALSCHPICKA